MIAEIKFYIMLLWRRMPLFAIIFVAFASAGAFAAFTLPPIFKAQTRLLVESSQISEKLAASTVALPAKEQLQLFEARLMTRENLLAVANQLKPLADQEKMSPDQIVLAMRAATKISTSSGRDQATLMTLTFESPFQAMTAAVLDEYLTFILEEDAQYRAGRAGQTEEFFRQEVERLSGELSKQSAAILVFKNDNGGALPEGLNYRRSLQLDLQDRIAQIDREIENQTDQRRRLQQIFDTTGSVAPAQKAQSPEQNRLAQLKAELSDLEAVYAANSPRVNVLRNRVEQLEASILDEVVVSTAEDALDPATAVFQLQLGEIDLRVEQLAVERERYDVQRLEVEEAIAATPSNALTLEAYERDYENLQGQYNAAVDRLAVATTGERIETLSRGQRVAVIEQPSVPNEPFKPNRKQIAAMGVGGGVAVGGGLIILLELLSTTVKRSADLTSKLQITPLVTIPYMRTTREARRRRFLRVLLLLAIFVAIPVGLWSVHTFVMPFDLIARRLAARFGFYF